VHGSCRKLALQVKYIHVGGPITQFFSKSPLVPSYATDSHTVCANFGSLCIIDKCRLVGEHFYIISRRCKMQRNVKTQAYLLCVRFIHWPLLRYLVGKNV
jgi:hypothetical protein